MYTDGAMVEFTNWDSGKGKSINPNNIKGGGDGKIGHVTQTLVKSACIRTKNSTA